MNSTGAIRWHQPAAVTSARCRAAAASGVPRAPCASDAFQTICSFGARWRKVATAASKASSSQHGFAPHSSSVRVTTPYTDTANSQIHGCLLMQSIDLCTALPASPVPSPENENRSDTRYNMRRIAGMSGSCEGQCLSAIELHQCCVATHHSFMCATIDLN